MWRQEQGGTIVNKTHHIDYCRKINVIPRINYKYIMPSTYIYLLYVDEFKLV